MSDERTDKVGNGAETRTLVKNKNLSMENESKSVATQQRRIPT